MTVEPGGFYVYPPVDVVTASPAVMVPPPRPQSLPLVTQGSGDPFAAPTSFRPDTDRFLGPYPVPALANYVALSQRSQYLPPVQPAGTPGYRKGNGIGRVVPVVNIRNVDHGRPN